MDDAQSVDKLEPVDAVLDLVQSISDDVRFVGNDVELLTQYIRRDFRSFRFLIVIWATISFLGVCAILFEIGRLRGLL